MNYDAMKRETDRLNRYGTALGREVLAISPGYAKLGLKITEAHLNPIGSVHGGVLATLTDEAAGHAAFSRGIQMTTVDLSTHYLRPAIGSTYLTAEAKEMKFGKHICVYDVIISDENGRVLTESICTYMSLGTPVPGRDEA